MVICEVPCPGLDAHGKIITCAQRISMSREDVIAFQRYIFNQHSRETNQRDPMDFTDEELLTEYKIVHWAWETHEE